MGQRGSRRRCIRRRRRRRRRIRRRRRRRLSSFAPDEFDGSFHHFDEPVELESEEQEAPNIAVSRNGERHLHRPTKTLETVTRQEK